MRASVPQGSQGHLVSFGFHEQSRTFPGPGGAALPFNFRFFQSLLPLPGLPQTRAQLRFASVTECLSKDLKPFHSLLLKYDMRAISIGLIQYDGDS